VLGPVGFLGGREASGVDRLGIGRSALRVVDAGESVEALDDIGMFGSERLLADLEGRLRKGFGLVALALGAEHPGKVVECCGEPRIMIAEDSRLLLGCREMSFSFVELARLVGVPAGVVLGLPVVTPRGWC